MPSTPPSSKPIAVALATIEPATVTVMREWDGLFARTYEVGYKLHLAVDTASEMPLAFTVAPANKNEKTFSVSLFNGAVNACGGMVIWVTADIQYSSRAFRVYARRRRTKTAIPYPANQKLKARNVLHTGRDFTTHGPERLKRVYRKRSIIELVFARLKAHLTLTIHRVRGVASLTTHVAYCLLCLLYTVEASITSNQPAKARSITFWAN